MIKRRVFLGTIIREFYRVNTEYLSGKNSILCKLFIKSIIVVKIIVLRMSSTNVYKIYTFFKYRKITNVEKNADLPSILPGDPLWVCNFINASFTAPSFVYVIGIRE